MDCLTFRRTVLADPRRADGGMIDHVAKCGQCDDYRHEIQRLDSVLESAIKVPMPECLPARILVRQSNKSGRFSEWGLSAALAACCVIVVIIGLRIDSQESPLRWQAAVQSYMNQTVFAPGIASSVGHGEVNTVLTRVGVELSPSVGEIAAVVPCVIGDHRGAHLIVSGKHGPVTVLIMPDADIDKPLEFWTAGRSGVIAPCPRGSIGGANEPIDEIRQRFERAITFI